MNAILDTRTHRYPVVILRNVYTPEEVRELDEAQEDAFFAELEMDMLQEVGG